MKTNNGATMVKVFELRYKDSNDLIIASIKEDVVRKEFIDMKKGGEDMSNIFGCENFMKIEEWNNAMLGK
jgi:hypothetical protein